MMESISYSRRYGQQLEDNNCKNVLRNIIELESDKIEEGDTTDLDHSKQRKNNNILMTEIDCFFDQILRKKSQEHNIE